MKLPVSPPPLLEIIGGEAASRILSSGLGPAPQGKYRHWDTLRHLAPPNGLSAEEHWAAVKFARLSLYRPLPLRDTRGKSFQYAVPSVALEMLHRIDRNAAGIIGSPRPVTDPQSQASYLLRSVIEEAITSSQLEGASTTRRVAKDMLLTGRAPRDRSERMILNNYTAMQHVRSVKEEAISPGRVVELQQILTEGTLDDPSASGRLRQPDDDIVVADDLTGAVLHRPPASHELRKRLDRLCEFANGETYGEFIHPVVRAILVHFWLAYDHPFVDGNGRTARALFYWVMAREGYWLCEYVSISKILRQAKAKYARAFLYSETDDNDATYFILHQLKVLLRAIDELHMYLDTKIAEVKEAEVALKRIGKLGLHLNDRQINLLTHALEHPEAQFTLASHSTAHSVAYATARSDLFDMVRRRLLVRSRIGRKFIFTPAPNLRARLQLPPLAG